MTEYRAAQTLLFFQTPHGGLVAFNYLQNKRFSCSPDVVGFLTRLNTWCCEEQLLGVNNEGASRYAKDQLQAFKSAGGLVEKGSQQAEFEDQHLKSWGWGPATAAYHASLRNRPVVSVEEATEAQKAKLSSEPQPAPYFETSVPTSIDMDVSPLTAQTVHLFDVLQDRHSDRDAGGSPVLRDELGLLLSAGCSIRSLSKNPAGATIVHKSAPSGGGKNPYDVYVMVRRVTGLTEGIYRYAPATKRLQYVGACEVEFSELLNGQDWPNNMDCLVVLVANFERVMWKYNDANAYRVVLIEAGHIVQNMMLTGTTLNLAMCPSAALNTSLFAQTLALDDELMSPAIYALGVGRKSDYEMPELGMS